jgi:serine/threonine-protein kinase
MEYLEGVNLRQVLHKAATMGRRVSPAVACRIMIDVLKGLGYAHGRTADDGTPLGLVHRDATPANVFVTWNGNVKVIDFGVAKETRGADRNLTRCGEIKGKVAYMSPEQIQRRPLDARSDLFSAGIILWELLTLRRLFARKSDFDSLVAVCKGDVPPPSKYLPMLPRELDYICARALARDPEQRYLSAEEMIWDLEQVVLQYGWAATPEALRHELNVLFNFEGEEDEEVELFHELPPARENEMPTTRTLMRGEPQAIQALKEAPTDPSLYESWDDAARSYRARGRGFGIAAIAAACLLLGAAAAGVARQISNAPPLAAISASVGK